MLTNPSLSLASDVLMKRVQHASKTDGKTQSMMPSSKPTVKPLASSATSVKTKVEKPAGIFQKKVVFDGSMSTRGG